MPKSFPKIKRDAPSTLQVNLGLKCNQACVHCHVDAGPHRWEMMATDIIKVIPDILKKYSFSTLDITGGAPELHPYFKELVSRSRGLVSQVIDRCNLTILSEPGFEDLAEFLADQDVTVIASLPCYEEKNVDIQRGKGVFERSIEGIKLLNGYGYGYEKSKLELNLVFNPQGASLPPPQKVLEADYKEKLYKKHGIVFNNLFTIANVPINRFERYLAVSGELSKYYKLLEESHNPSNLNTVMCKSLISVNWEGYLYDCDFNQQIDIQMPGGRIHIKDILDEKVNFKGNPISIGKHCFACTAGNGSSCTGSLTDK